MTPPTYLAELNSHERDQYILFEEIGHKYTIKGKMGYTSVTTLISKLFEHFDANKIIDKMMLNTKKMSDPSNVYFGMSKQEILAVWSKNGKNASEKGTAMHANIENYYSQIESDDGSIEYGFFKNFLTDFPDLKEYRTEWCVYDEDLKICGSIDMIFENEDGSLQIYDWKRVKSIDFENFDHKKVCLIPGLENIPDSNYFHYSIQLNIYRYLLEKNYCKKVTDLYLVVFHPNQQNYERIEVSMLDEEIALILEWWSNNKLTKGLL